MEITKPIIFYKTTADFNNTGEVLIYRTLLENLREYGHVIVDDSSHIQPLFLKRIGIRDDERRSRYTDLSFTKFIIASSFKNIFARHRMYFATGVGDHAVIGFKGAIKNFISFLFILLIRLCGVKTLRIGMSIRFEGTLAKLSERLLAVAIPNYFVRDSISADNCHKAGVNVRIAPDLSWGYRVSGIKHSNKDSNLIILSFRDYVTRQAIEPYRTELYNCIGSLLKHIFKDKTKKVLLTYQCDHDKYVQEEILRKFGHLGNISIAHELITLENANEYYGKASIVLSNRLHVLLLGYKYGALTIGLTDLKAHVKIRGIFEDAHLGSHLIDIHQPIENIYSHYDSLASNIEDNWQDIHRMEARNYQSLKEVFERVFKDVK